MTWPIKKKHRAETGRKLHPQHLWCFTRLPIKALAVEDWERESDRREAEVEKSKRAEGLSLPFLYATSTTNTPISPTGTARGEGGPGPLCSTHTNTPSVTKAKQLQAAARTDWADQRGTGQTFQDHRLRRTCKFCRAVNVLVWVMLCDFFFQKFQISCVCVVTVQVAHCAWVTWSFLSCMIMCASCARSFGPMGAGWQRPAVL